MADNENEGSTGSIRQGQGGKRRREPPIIDAKAADFARVTPSQAPEAPAGDPPSSEPAPIEPKAAEPEEPVLFGQVLRSGPASPGAAETTPEPLPSEGAKGVHGTADDTASAAPMEPVPHPEPPAPQPDGSRSGAQDPGSPAKEQSSSAAGGSPFGEPASSLGSDTMAAFVVPPRQRSSAGMVLGAAVGILLLVIAGLLVAGSQRGAGDDIKAALDAANARLAALEARADPAPLSTQLAQLDQRAGAADTRVEALKAAADDLGKRLNDVAAEVQANAAKIAAPAQAAAPAPADPGPAPVPAATSADLSALAGRVDDLARKVDTIPPQAAPVPAIDLSALAGRVDDLSRKVDTIPPQAAPMPAVDLAPLQGRTADLTRRLDGLDAAVAAWPKLDLGPTEKRIADLGARTADLDRGLKALSGAVAALPRVDLEPLKAALASEERRIAPLEAAIAAPKAGERATEARAVGSADVARAAPLAVVAQEVGRRIDEGRPMVTEVDALRALGVEDATLAPLAAVAENGAPTPAALKARWGDIEPDVAAATRPARGDSLFDKFTAGARQIVSVRRVGAPVGEDPASRDARIGAALDDGDVASALAEWAKLPPAGQGASKEWADAARARLEAEAAARGLASRAIETLAKAKG